MVVALVHLPGPILESTSEGTKCSCFVIYLRFSDFAKENRCHVLWERPLQGKKRNPTTLALSCGIDLDEIRTITTVTGLCTLSF